ncbi:SAM-dependent methyltransferase [Actinoallomurus purpureus]|uniref:class I SAM-dependent methyltransferase n=1 Tax=Actinoallomurus purpureus TaxID=478114 RepID=UPI0020936A29|nr:SAM-dependent methyltransferase [Actinoallomurus purpureus]MCO6010505.1 SAM-dependent methyltransferase [Actinoallomurus purpureus]
MIGGLYEGSLAGLGSVRIEHADGRREPLPVDQWCDGRPGDDALLDRCAGPTLDVGSGPGRLTVALAERGLPALGIDVTPYAVEMTRAAGGLALLRDVFDHVPGAGRWETVLLADGNIGIGGDPPALLRRVEALLHRRGRAIVELGATTRTEWVRLRDARQVSDWFRWSHVARDAIGAYAEEAGLRVAEIWTEAGRWFADLTPPG